MARRLQVATALPTDGGKKIHPLALDVWIFFYRIPVILCVFISQFLAKWLKIFFETLVWKFFTRVTAKRRTVYL